MKFNFIDPALISEQSLIMEEEFEINMFEEDSHLPLLGPPQPFSPIRRRHTKIAVTKWLDTNECQCGEIDLLVFLPIL